MRTLAIETTTRPGSIALLDGTSCVVEEKLDPAVPMAASLFTTTRRLLDAWNLTPARVDLVCAAIGPGSFTGTRVGVMFAKTWAYARRVPVCGIETSDVLAEQAREAIDAGTTGWDDFLEIWTAIDAQRGEWFVRSHAVDVESRRNRSTLRPSSASRIARPDEWLDALDRPCWLTGPGLLLPATDDRNPATGRPGIRITDRSVWEPRAATVGRIGVRRREGGVTDDPWTLAPRYVRKSAAEEKWDAKCAADRSGPEQADVPALAPGKPDPGCPSPPSTADPIRLRNVGRRS
ncbi:MAG: tRNA (adenosine(37)-N6)-threonylcarbamoyltransferase complex dimerization subunit type 1 TsaB [Planctomycetes bacterium]|nr:tRNA (adenosine(37)-N6)-threonylcarbamoyltransferase complex dimerization subunit type 1 TsaB [Planctomycetota bacterium]